MRYFNITFNLLNQRIASLICISSPPFLREITKKGCQLIYTAQNFFPSLISIPVLPSSGEYAWKTEIIHINLLNYLVINDRYWADFDSFLLCLLLIDTLCFTNVIPQKSIIKWMYDILIIKHSQKDNLRYC